MRRLLSILGLQGLGLVTATAGTAPIFINNSPIISPPDPAPQVDATAFVNRSLINLSTFGLSSTPQGFLFLGFTQVPFETANTLFFTNTSSGVLEGSPGWRFEFTTNGVRKRMDTWVNFGQISGSTWVLVNASNILSRGAISAGPSGLVRLLGNDIDVSRIGLRTGTTPNLPLGDGFILGTNYVPASGESEAYWGLGTNNSMRGSTALMALDQGNFDVPFPNSPLHDVMYAFSTNVFPNTVAPFGAAAFVHTNLINATSRVVQVVFVRTNYFDTNLSVRVKFVPDGLASFFGGQVDEGLTVMVEFNSQSFDIAAQVPVTNSLYFIDRTAFDTNMLLLINFNDPALRRPSTFEIARNKPFGFDQGEDPNFPWSPTLLWNPNYASNAVSSAYAAYGATISSAVLTNTSLLPTIGPGQLVINPALSDPTNLPGRIELVGDALNLNQTRIRAESTIIIRARDVVSNHLALVDAPYCVYDLGSSQSPFVISNLVPPVVSRFAGSVEAYSVIWDNFEQTAFGTNLIRFHVLVLDAGFQSDTPVIVSELGLHATNLVVHDQIEVGKSLLLEAQGLRLTGGLSLPSGASWAATNVVGLEYLTNEGTLNIPGAAFYGADRSKTLFITNKVGRRIIVTETNVPWPYQVFINRGTNIASSQFIQAGEVHNRGLIEALGGLLSIEADQVHLTGPPVSFVTNLFTNIVVVGNQFFTNTIPFVSLSAGSSLIANSDVEIRANSLTTSNAFILAGSNAPGALILYVTNSLSDSGLPHTNLWTASAGARLKVRPQTGNLLGTHLTSRAPIFSQESFHEWAGEDRGPTVAGYSNNVALGKLTLDGAPFSLMHFRPPPGLTNAALYVDYLELLNYSTNVNDALSIWPGMTVYFANANIPPEKLDGAVFGRLRWVPDFAGPLSSTNILYPTNLFPQGLIVTTNIALAQSKNLDSDGDTIVNAVDPTPFYVPESVDLQIAFTKGGGVFVSWNALRHAENTLEATADLNGPWQTVTNFVYELPTSRVELFEPLSEARRFYRVRVEPMQP